VPFDGGCWHTSDPATLLITSHHTDLSGEGFPFILRNEYLQDDVNKFSTLAGRRRPAATLGQATRGRPERSARFREIYVPHGWGGELRASFDAAGLSWGSVMLLRERGRPDFTPEEVAFVASIARHVAHGLRTAMLSEAAATAPGPDAPGVVILDGQGEPESMTTAAERWLAELDDLDPAGVAPLPASVTAVATRARAAPASEEPARARVRVRSGRWLVLHGSALGDGRAVVVLKPASAPELAPLVAAAYGLTPREREVMAALMRGLATAEIADRLVVSPHTAQDHVKSILEKTGARNRQELIARVFYEHAEARVHRHEALGDDGWFTT
jgi:DNA-binding CsgD family transcriptional regulator